ncbi:hypothetical protein OU994_29240 [Pseudoduganella sp. SL102]|uniref:hypothetical protein n=1 Tax=Pseudoduganella sp. SL102 TaxID=2995154 RepID=UPI00248B03D2|nr:hypothetical protein [Pseudoduganella sp. SL102]WBS02284.1 hypothetical protein OU994_29240 [Pseudoduganella sp. SL102]
MTATTCSSYPANALFRKERAGIYPYATGRDLAILGMLLLTVIGGLLLAGHWLGYANFVLPVVTGTTTGIVMGVQQYRPVHGVVPAGARTALLAQLADLGFIASDGAGNEALFVHKAPRWRRWDANRVTLRQRPDGDFDAALPHCVFHRMKDRSLAL